MRRARCVSVPAASLAAAPLSSSRSVGVSPERALSLISVVLATSQSLRRLYYLSPIHLPLCSCLLLFRLHVAIASPLPSLPLNLARARALRLSRLTDTDRLDAAVTQSRRRVLEEPSHALPLLLLSSHWKEARTTPTAISSLTRKDHVGGTSRCLQKQDPSTNLKASLSSLRIASTGTPRKAATNYPAGSHSHETEQEPSIGGLGRGQAESQAQGPIRHGDPS